MDEQDPGPEAPQAADKQPTQQERPASESANDSTWGMGSASALDQLRRHDFRSRRSRPADAGERPQSE